MISRTSTEAHGSTGKSIAQIGNELNVDRRRVGHHRKNDRYAKLLR